MKIETLEHTDVRGNKLNYLKFTNKLNTTLLINIGEKTKTAIEKLQEEEKNDDILDDVDQAFELEEQENKKQKTKKIK